MWGMVPSQDAKRPGGCVNCVTPGVLIPLPNIHMKKSDSALYAIDFYLIIYLALFNLSTINSSFSSWWALFSPIKNPQLPEGYFYFTFAGKVLIVLSSDYSAIQAGNHLGSRLEGDVSPPMAVALGYYFVSWISHLKHQLSGVRCLSHIQRRFWS